MFSEKRLKFVYYFGIFVILIFSVKLLQLAVVKGDLYRAKAENRTEVNYRITAARGEILDRNGRLIAGNKTTYNLVVYNVSRSSAVLVQALSKTIDVLKLTDRSISLPTIEQQQKDEVSKKYDLSILDVERRETLYSLLYDMEQKGFSITLPYKLLDDLSVQAVAILKEHSFELPGIEIEQASSRVVADGTLLPHILGAVAPIYAEELEQMRLLGYSMNDKLGKWGVEKSFESQLRGKDGTMNVVRDKSGALVEKTITSEPIQGDTVVLTVDIELQEKVNDALESFMSWLQAKPKGLGGDADGGSVVVVEVASGDILAASNYKNYDLNTLNSYYGEYSQIQGGPLFNRAFQGLYRPGSAFKPVVAVAALNEGIISEQTTVLCTGKYEYYSDVGFTPGCTGVHGNISVKQALMVSCNSFFYEIGRQLTEEKYNETAKKLGLSVKTGVEIAEKIGSLTTRDGKAEGDRFEQGDIIQGAIGQGNTLVTTVSLASYAATLAKNGVRVQTHLVERVLSYDNAQYKYIYDNKILDVLNNNNNAFDITKAGMVLVSKNALAGQFLADIPVDIAVKTGTSQSGGYYDGSIIAYFPADNPKIAIAAVVEKAADSYFLASLVRDIYNIYSKSEKQPFYSKPFDSLL